MLFVCQNAVILIFKIDFAILNIYLSTYFGAAKSINMFKAKNLWDVE